MDWRNHNFDRKHLCIEKARTKERQRETLKEKGLEIQKGESSGGLRVLDLILCCRDFGTEIEKKTTMVQQKLRSMEIEKAVPKEKCLELSKLKARTLPVISYPDGSLKPYWPCLLLGSFL